MPKTPKARPRRPIRGRPPSTKGATERRLVVELSSRARKAALIDESEAIGLSLGDYVERLLFAYRRKERLRIASRSSGPRTVDEALAL